MNIRINPFKYLLFLAQLLFIASVCQGQNDTLLPEPAIGVNADNPEWYFTDTLIRQLITNNTYFAWKEIRISDQVYPKYLKEITLTPNKRKVLVFDSAGTKTKAVSKKRINAQLSQLVQQIAHSDSVYLNYRWNADPLEQYQLDSIWFKNEITSIWDKYRRSEKINLNEEQIEVAAKALQDYNALERFLRTPANWNPDESSMVDLKVIYDFDTLHIQATSSFVYSLPWFYFNNQTRLSNSEISETVGELLKISNSDSGNLNRLSGVNFEWALIDDIYNRYLKEKLDAH